jgi:hypothetical protein
MVINNPESQRLGVLVYFHSHVMDLQAGVHSIFLDSQAPEGAVSSKTCYSFSGRGTVAKTKLGNGFKRFHSDGVCALSTYSPLAKTSRTAKPSNNGANNYAFPQKSHMCHMTTGRGDVMPLTGKWQITENNKIIYHKR